MATNKLQENERAARIRAGTMRYSVATLFDIIKEQDPEKGDVLAANQKALYELKREIAACSKKNYNWEQEIHNLDQKIALLIRNRITLEEVLAQSRDINSLLLQRTTTLKDKREREQYGQLFFILQHDTQFIASLARLVKMAEIDNLLQTVMFTLYGNQYDDEEEHLLLSMFQRVLKQEFEESTTISNFLRANTALTRMMTTYTRRGPGQQYLQSTLTNIMISITSNDEMTLEINPHKVFEAWANDYETRTGQPCPLPRTLTPEQAAATKEIKEIIEPRLQKLDELANKFIDTIIQSLDTIPYGIRWICKQIRDLAKAKWPDASRQQVCSLIGGFFLLRFVNPAVVTPQAFMQLNTKMSANTRRNLTLLAKVLQNLANNTQFGGLKEFYMEPLNQFLDSCRPRLNTFLEDITRVEDLDEHLQLDRYLRMGKIHQTSINISLNEVYFIHGLLIEHLETLTKDAKDAALKTLLTELGPAPPLLPRAENANVELLLENRQPRLSESEENASAKPAQLYTECKYLIFTIIKSLPIKSLPALAADRDNLSLMIAEAAKFADSQKDVKMAEKVKKLQSNIERLVGEGFLSPEDNFVKLRKDTMAELINYEAQIERTNSDLDRLKAVLSSIHRHNQYLQQQYETYKTYLANVRTNVTAVSSTKSKDKDKKEIKKGPYKFSHQKLMQDGVLVESEVPEERRSSIFFSFTSSSPGVFEVAVLYKSRQISEMKLVLDDLLEKQHSNDINLETEFLKLNVNMLIFLLNKHFMS